MKKALLALLFLVAYGFAVVAPSWQAVQRADNGRDFATYHYAWKAAREGNDPYDKQELNKLAREEGERRTVNPYFYPPPFLLAMAWDGDLSLPAAYRAAYWINQAALAGVLLVLWLWLEVPLVVFGVLLLTFTPIPDNLKMGQANLPVLLFAVLALWRTNGIALGLAAMAKMSPALYLAWWTVRRRWTAVMLAVATAIALTIVSLGLVELPYQLRFYTEVLPRFAGGPYHALTVPITLTANHSIPDLYNQLWPGPDKFTLSGAARLASAATNLGLLALLCAIGRRERDTLSDACLAGAFTVLMVATPVYAYEHHLVFLLLPLAAVGTALLRGRLPPAAWGLAGVAYAFLAWPLGWREPISKAVPALAWFIQESKFFGMVLLGILCAWGAVAAGGAAAKKAPKAVKRPKASGRKDERKS